MAPAKQQNVPFRVIADHSRATAFLIADGVLPSNEGRGYVLRRIMRRAIRFGRLLNLPTPFLSRVCDGVVELMGEIYPELVAMHHIMTQVVTGEEERFADTLDHGLKLLGDELDYLKTHSQKILPGEVAFKLYDTYGFPLDLVQDTLREEGLVLDLEGFEAHMRAQREASRQSWKGGPGEELPRSTRNWRSGRPPNSWATTPWKATATSWPSSSSPGTTTRPRPARRWRWSPGPPPSTASPAARWGTPASSPATAGASG